MKNLEAKMSEVNLTAVKSMERLKYLMNKVNDQSVIRDMVFDLITRRNIPENLYEECVYIAFRYCSGFDIYTELYCNIPGSIRRYSVNYDDEFSTYLFRRWINRYLHEGRYAEFKNVNVSVGDFIELKNYENSKKTNRALMFNLINIMNADCADFLINNIDSLNEDEYSDVVIYAMHNNDLVSELFKHSNWYEKFCKVDPMKWIVLSKDRQTFISILKRYNYFNKFFAHFKDYFVEIVENDKMNITDREWSLAQLTSAEVLPESTKMHLNRMLGVEKIMADSLEEFGRSGYEDLINQIKKEIDKITS